MLIDTFTTLVFNIIASFLMSAGLFIVSQSYLTDVKGIRRWATALFLLGIGWILTILFGVIPNFFSQVIGSTFLLLGLAFYFHALARFKAVRVSVQWAYLVVILGFIGSVYFVVINVDLNHKITITALCSTILLFANSMLSFSKQQNTCPKSHILTGSIFFFCASILLVRTIYYGFWHTQLEQSPLHLNFVQAISYLGAAITVFGTSFGFILMCNEKYIAEKNHAQSAKQEAFDRLQKIASHVPGVVFQFNLSATGQFSVPYSSDGIQTIFRLSPEQVREDAQPIFERIYVDDYDDYVNSIYQSAHNLTPWSREFRVQFEDGSIHWLEGNAAPQRHQDGSTLWHGFVSDITERKQVEQKLRDSEAFTNSILNSLTAHIAVLDSEGIIIAVNNAWQQFGDDNGLQAGCYAVGISYFTACQKTYEQGCEDSLNVQDGITAVLKGTTDSFHLEYPCHSPTEQRWFSMNVSPLNGLQQGVVVSHQNITERKKMEEALTISESRFRTIIQTSPIPLSLNDSQQNITFLNTAFIQTFGYEIKDIPTLWHWWEQAYPDPVYRQWASDRWQSLLKQTESEQPLFTPLELNICCKNGAFKTVLVNASAILESFEYVHLVMFYDIHERKQAETELRIAATVFESQEGMFITDINGVIVKVNQTFTSITGYSAAEAIGQTPHLLSSGRHDKAFYNALWQSIYDTGLWQGEIWNRRKNGEIYPEWLTITAVRANNDHEITHYVATFIDITERKQAEETIKQLAFYDPLTGLPNRRLLYERLKHGIELSHRTAKPMAVLMMDLDKFKAVNDNLGHAAGDELLQQVAIRIKSRLREMDTVARLGGDEFVIILEELSNHHEDIAHVANEIIVTLSQPFTLSQNHVVSIGASIGIGIYPQHGNSVEALMDNADTALYRAKYNGRGCFAYFS